MNRLKRWLRQLSQRRWPKWTEVLFGITMLALMSGISWSIAFSAVSYVKEKRGQSEQTAAIVRDARVFAASADLTPAIRDSRLRAAAEAKHYMILIADAAGRIQRFGTASADRLTAAPEAKDVRTVLAGGTIQRIERPNLFKPGAMIVGIPAKGPTGGRAALFVESDTPSLYDGYGSQLFTIYLGMLVSFLLILLLRPWRQGMHAWVEVIGAIRRMSKGDFNVKLRGDSRHMPGQLGELAESLNDMASELSQMEAMRQAFISNVSHEIQSPLTSIRGFARALQQDGLSDEQRLHYYGIIETESVRLSKLSDNLMKLTSLESDKHPFEPKRYRLDKQLRSMVLACEPQWLEKNMLIDIELSEIWVTADEDLMSQVWMNLLSNGIKFTPEGGTIGVEAVIENDAIAVILSDNGPGISEDDLPYIFDRFFKADKSRNRAAGGSGLGLSIVKKIVDMHGGTIEARSSAGVGTTFTVRLPQRRSGTGPA
ncbi:sensor histidine kinase [Paenibacillus humicola]|uniref:sensor histidine kinase n=1 Tax=Paenibacillus humicola TaxID=3110540 RepID=UPI00237AA742|nr:HAMP domain-containing sensor histidine kinase [Paenibacillus humicola]